MNRPDKSSYPSYYARYVDAVIGEDVLNQLQVAKKVNCDFLRSLPLKKWDFSYAEGKWTIKELVLHMIDTERIFTYRALCMSRGDKTPMPGFDENEYVPNSGANNRTIQSILDEYKAVRQATLALFYNFTPEMWERIGTASGNEFVVRSIAFILVGHEIHHFKILKERYLDS